MLKNIQSLRCLMSRFGFLKDHNPQGGRFSQNTTNQNIQKDRHALSPQDNAIDIDLSKLKLDYFEDTENLIHHTSRLKHGLQKFLNGQLVFGDQGVGKLPQQQQSKSNKLISQISGYIQPHKDQQLRLKGQEKGCRYISSTSSISSPLVVLYYIFSSFRIPQTDNLFEGIPGKPLNWMISFRKPTCFYLHKLEDGRQAIVSDKGVMPVQNEVLMNLGHVVQYFLTHTRQQTDMLMRGQAAPMPTNYYRYSAVNNDLMLRSQIDCMSYDKDGKPFVFQIKSRACAPIRYDVQNYQLYKDYEISSKRGMLQSFQRQYYDLIRGGFLKYVMQVKIGGMNGAFIAYHNTEKIYGYEYVQLKEMALRVFGDQYNLDVSFVCISKMLVIVLDHIRQSLKQYKDDSLKIGFYADSRSKKLIVMVQAMNVTKQYIPLKQNPQGIENVLDYFKKHTQIKNPIFKFKFDFFTYLNGVRLCNPEVLLTPHDTLEIKYKASPRIIISKQQYMLFLYQAYKQPEISSLSHYRGIWEFNEIFQ